MALVVLAVMAACSTPPAPTPPAGPAPAPAAAPSRAPAPPAVAEPLGARWQRADYADLPGWAEDRAAQLWPAVLRGCDRPSAPWREFCARAVLEAPADDAAVRRFLQQWLQPWRLESADGSAEGLATGYFEPEFEAVRQPREGFGVALHSPPADLSTRRPLPTRQEYDSAPAVQASLRGRELAWIRDPIDLMMLQIQGSGRLRLSEADGRVTPMRVAFAGHNQHPYRSPGRWLVEQGEGPAQAMSWDRIRSWAQKNPSRLNELMWSNPRVVFFRLEPLPDAGIGPRGAQGVALTPMRSVAVDPRAVPYGSPMWIDTTDPLTSRPLRLSAMAQDTGGAILGAVRVDLFCGWGDTAQAMASKMKHPLRAWVLWPRGSALPVLS